MATHDAKNKLMTFTLRQLVLLHPREKFLDSTYKVLSQLGKGIHSEVYEVVDEDHRIFAMKVQKVREDIPELVREFEICRYAMMSFQDSFYPIGLTLPYAYGQSHGIEYLIMDRFGNNLREIANKCDQGKLIPKDVLMVGIQAVRRLQVLHKKRILHCHVKPAHFGMGFGPAAEKTVHLFGFGAALFVQDWASYDYENDAGFLGTEDFAPVEALLHKARKRRGDMESLCCTLVWLAHGELPWSTSDPETGREFSRSEMAHERTACTTETLARQFPVLEEFVKTVLQIKRRDEPNYDHLIAILENDMSAGGAANDGMFKWLIPETQGTFVTETEEDDDQTKTQNGNEGPQQTINVDGVRKLERDVPSVMSKNALGESSDKEFDLFGSLCADFVDQDSFGFDFLPYASSSVNLTDEIFEDSGKLFDTHTIPSGTGKISSESPTTD